MAEGQGAEKLSTSYAAKEKAVQKFKEKENEKKPDTYANPTADFVGEEALDKETDKITKDIAEKGQVLAKPYADKLTAKLNTLVAGEKANLNQKLATINKGSAEKLVTLAAEAVVKLAAFKEIPEVKQIYELVQMKDKIAAISEMKLSTYASGSGYHQVIDKKFDALGFTEPKRREMQKILGVKVDGKVGPETINELSVMLQLGLKKVDYGKKTLSADGKTEFDAKGDVIAPPKADEPVAKPGEPGPAEPPVEGEKTKETPDQIAAAVFTEAQGVISKLEGNKLYELLRPFVISRDGNNIQVRKPDENGGKYHVCDIKVDDDGALKFADDSANIPRDGVAGALKGKIDAYVLNQNFFVKNEAADGYIVKFAGEMALKEYKVSKSGEKSADLTHSVAPGASGALEVTISSSEGKQVAKVTITKTGMEIHPEPDSPVVATIEGTTIVLSDKPEEPKPEEPKPVEPKPEEPKPEEPKPEEPKPEEPKPVEPKPEEPKPEEPKPEEPKPEEPKPEEPKPEEPKPEEPKPEEPKPEEPVKPKELNDRHEVEEGYDYIARVRSELLAKEDGFKGKNLERGMQNSYELKFVPLEIRRALDIKIQSKIESDFTTKIAPMIASLEGKLNTAQHRIYEADSKAAGLRSSVRSSALSSIRSSVKEVETAMSSLNVDSHLKTPEMKAFIDRMLVPMDRIDTLMFITKENPGPKTLAALKATINPMRKFIDDEKATLDFVALEQSIIAAMAEDANLSEDQQKVFNAAARVPEWHTRNDSTDRPVQYSFENRPPQNGDYRLVPDSGKAGEDTYKLYIYKAGIDDDMRHSEGWEFVANYSKTVFDDKVAKYETIDKTSVALKEAVATAHQALIAAKISNLYEDFKIDSDGLTLTDSTHSGDSPNMVCEFRFDEETGKITFKGVEVKAEDVAGKMREAGDTYIRGLEYPSDTIRQEEDQNNLKIKFKGEMNEQAYQIDDKDYSGGRTVAKVGGKFVVTYKTTENIPGGELGRIRQVTLATFTISKNGTVTINLNPKYAKTVDAKAAGGANAKITLKQKEGKESA